MRMKAAVLHSVREPLTIEEVELDPPKAGEVLVKMVASGICHSDIHYFTGDSPTNKPVVLGHGGAGIVEAVGKAPGVLGGIIDSHAAWLLLRGIKTL